MAKKDGGERSVSITPHLGRTPGQNPQEGVIRGYEGFGDVPHSLVGYLGFEEDRRAVNGRSACMDHGDQMPYRNRGAILGDRREPCVRSTTYNGGVPGYSYLHPGCFCFLIIFITLIDAGTAGL